jgi:CRP-like cAMP-binding protein
MGSKALMKKPAENNLDRKQKLTAGAAGEPHTSQFLHMIEDCPYFKGLSAAAAEQIKPMFFRKTIRKNEYFLNAGSCLEYLGYISKGVFRYFYIDADANDVTKYFVCEHDFVFSLSSFISKEPSLFYIEALEDSELMCASVADIRELISSSSEWQRIYRNILETTYIVKERREAEFLLCDARQRYLNFLHEYPGFDIKIKQHYIASFLGITPESLSRIRTQMSKS